MCNANALYCSADGSCLQIGNTPSNMSPALASSVPLKGRGRGSCSRDVSRASFTLPMSTREEEKAEGWEGWEGEGWEVKGVK